MLVLVLVLCDDGQHVEETGQVRTSTLRCWHENLNEFCSVCRPLAVILFCWQTLPTIICVQFDPSLGEKKKKKGRENIKASSAPTYANSFETRVNFPL